MEKILFTTDSGYHFTFCMADGTHDVFTDIKRKSQSSFKKVFDELQRSGLIKEGAEWNENVYSNLCCYGHVAKNIVVRQTTYDQEYNQFSFRTASSGGGDSLNLLHIVTQ